MMLENFPHEFKRDFLPTTIQKQDVRTYLCTQAMHILHLLSMTLTCVCIYTYAPWKCIEHIIMYFYHANCTRFQPNYVKIQT